MFFVNLKLPYSSGLLIVNSFVWLFAIPCRFIALVLNWLECPRSQVGLCFKAFATRSLTISSVHVSRANLLGFLTLLAVKFWSVFWTEVCYWSMEAFKHQLNLIHMLMMAGCVCVFLLFSCSEHFLRHPSDNIWQKFSDYQLCRCSQMACAKAVLERWSSGMYPLSCWW